MLVGYFEIGSLCSSFNEPVITPIIREFLNAERPAWRPAGHRILAPQCPIPWCRKKTQRNNIGKGFIIMTGLHMKINNSNGNIHNQEKSWVDIDDGMSVGYTYMPDCP